MQSYPELPKTMWKSRDRDADLDGCTDRGFYRYRWYRMNRKLTPKINRPTFLQPDILVQISFNRIFCHRVQDLILRNLQCCTSKIGPGLFSKWKCHTSLLRILLRLHLLRCRRFFCGPELLVATAFLGFQPSKIVNRSPQIGRIGVVTIHFPGGTTE